MTDISVIEEVIEITLDNGEELALTIIEEEIIVEVSENGLQGPPGPGVASGGTAGQSLVKSSGIDFATEWVSAADLPSLNLNLLYTMVDGTACVEGNGNIYFQEIT
jgi:hypothetical protein